ncbi:MAG TPA: glutathione peroxidase [Bacteroidales bacterium]|nr:glutathione peroxidase [Bacteroidales bacterium]HSA44224.1 glutathione peroxidase [Bacteroidales bacterium]
MKTTAYLILALLFPMILSAQEQSFYSLQAKTIDGEDLLFSSLKGKKVMIVNTASKCGLTPQYELLEKLYKQYASDQFIIIGFPANNFLSQEPGTNDEIREFCTKNYGVTFPMMAKISVKGEDMHPVYRWLTQKSLNGKLDSEVKWNFQKYLINEEGKLIMMVPPKEKPDSEQIIDWITAKPLGE